ncbi:hypothetical protein ABDK00_004150 [Niabella insulamsoli]|uniref:hypothetical protein n=1 Tax=Niabella insulamsoli TaxID=3144874 RepID=UPI0031FCBD29
MKKIATKFVLVAASTFIMSSVMAQTDTTKSPVPDTTKTPAPPPEPTEPTEPTDTTKAPLPPTSFHQQSTSSIAAHVAKFSHTFYAINNSAILNAKKLEMKEENEA